MLNIERYKEELKEFDRATLDCKIFTLKGKRDSVCSSLSCQKCRKDNIEWLLAETEILDDEEKRYLRGVIRPFRNEVKSIRKKIQDGKIYEFILIELSFDILVLPRFKKGTMYKGMVTNKEYTLEELGL